MVPWIFLLVSLVGAALVYNVYRPIRGGARVSALSFFVGWLTGELALHHIGWQAVATVVFVAFGALDGAAGWIGLAVTLVSWVFLGVYTVRGFEVRGVCEDALAEAFARDDATETPPDVALAEGIDWGPILAPFPIRHPDAERIRGVRYHRAAAIDLKLDVYRHRARPSGCPTFVYIHGGAWVIGDKAEQGLPLVWHLASKGWVCFNVNYRKSPHATWPDHLVDLKHALRWVREFGRDYGADPDFVVVSGGSAGGHLAAMLALTADDPSYQPGFEHVDTRVQGCVPIYGVFDFTNQYHQYANDGLERLLERQVMKATLAEEPELFRSASPIHRITPAAPPFFVIHGESDTLVPIAEARAFVDAFRKTAKAPIAFATIPGAQHAFELFPSVRSQLARNGVERFLEILRSRRAATAPERAATG